MFFYLSKVVWFLINPANAVLLLAGIGVILRGIGAKRWGIRLMAAAFALTLLITVVPIGSNALVLLENRFPAVVELPERVDGIVVLGGTVDVGLTEARGQLSVNGSMERLIAFADLARRYPEAKLVFTGGSGTLGRPDLQEALVVPEALRRLGLNSDRVVYEANSRNTYQNAELTKALVQPPAGSVWVLVTSAFHMPRAMGCFRAVDWEMFPYPVDYVTDGQVDWRPGFGVLQGFSSLTVAVREFAGLLAYRLTGRSSAVFPGPMPIKNRP